MADASLGTQASSGFAWNAVGSAVRAGLGFLVNLILARLLGPEPFGLFAIIMLLLSLSNLVIDTSLGTALIQRQNIEPQDIRFVFGWQLVVSLLIGSVLFAFPHWLSTVFEQAALAAVLPWVALTIVLSALAQVPTALLRRRMDFRAVQIAQIASYILGYAAVGIVMAMRGTGLWSLVWAQLAQVFINLVLVVAFSRFFYWPSLRGDFSLLRFGLRVLAANIVNWIGTNFDTFIVGRAFGKTPLGYYNRVNFLVGSPLGIITGSVQGVLLSSVVKIQTEHERIRRVYLAVTELTSLLTFPLFFGLSVIGLTLMEGVYGSQWSASAPLVLPVCFSMIAGTMMMLPGVILTALGKVEVELRQTVINSVIFLPLIYWASQHSLLAVAWSVVAYRIGFFSLLQLALLPQLTLHPAQYVRALVRPVVVGIAFAVALMGLNHFLQAQFLPATLRLLLCMGVMGLGYLLAFLVWPQHTLSAPTHQFLSQVGPYQRVRRLFRLG